MKQEMSRRGRASSSGTDAPLDEEVAKRLKFLKMFLHSSPPEYAANPDHDQLEAVEWLRGVKKCLNIVNAPEGLRVEFAAYTLTGAADYWWDLVRRNRDVESMTWEEFEEMFLNKYFPPFLRDDKLNEFVNLTQGKMTVAQYEAKFIQLSWHARYLLKSSDSAQWFIRGLNPRIASVVASNQECNTYDKVVAEALRLEHVNDLCDRVQESFDVSSAVAGTRNQQKRCLKD